MEVRRNPEAAGGDTIKLHLNNEVVTALRVQSTVPEPVSSEPYEGGVIYTFPAASMLTGRHVLLTAWEFRP